ncbi:MAG: anaerobic ribonucleoside-triphosphate reductase activating protein [bacterium]
MKIAGIQKTTLVDYPGKIASTIFTLGCNMRCPYCHNKQISFDFAEPELLDTNDVMAIIKERHKFIDGITITGGEPTLQKDLLDFCKEIKSKFGLLIKLDTNGSLPMIVKRAIDEKLVDYIALDLKTSFSRYKECLGIDGEIIYGSYKMIRDSGIDYEIRMTCYPDFINTSSLSELLGFLNPSDKIFIQKCNVVNLDEQKSDYENGQLELFGNIMESKGFYSTLIRGIA